MAQIIDGYTLTPNIFAEDIGKHNISMYGSGDYVLSVGECLGYELVSNNEIRIKDGMFLIQGRRGLIKTGTADTCIIENGAQAVKRNDLIVMEYKKDEATLVESHTTKVIKGTPGTTAVDPQIVTGDIQNGAVLHQMPLYRVKIEGLNIVAVEQLFEFGSVAAETVDPMLATKDGFAADALAVKKQFDKQNSKIDSIIKNTVEFLQGEATISQVYPGSTNSLLVQFEKPFSGIPVVLCSILYKTEQSGPHIGNIESISDITQSGFIVNIKNTGMTYARNYTFNWTANIDTSNT